MRHYGKWEKIEYRFYIQRVKKENIADESNTQAEHWKKIGGVGSTSMYSREWESEKRKAHGIHSPTQYIEPEFVYSIEYDILSSTFQIFSVNYTTSEPNGI